MPVKTKITAAKILSALTWIFEIETKPLTIKEVLNIGDHMKLFKLGAEEVGLCLSIGTKGFDGEYIII
ncbi:hypothetical protein [Psychromonas ossibalaenae]|uniref:hypothetical protein n=1 Tax=Psychromonas ossibalaenae TaxID=444922 RepID=UPI00037AB203|nr:hypothetical protein [Psychromonas ossibalaenae]